MTPAPPPLPDHAAGRRGHAIEAAPGRLHCRHGADDDTRQPTPGSTLPGALPTSHTNAMTPATGSIRHRARRHGCRIYLHCRIWMTPATGRPAIEAATRRSGSIPRQIYPVTLHRPPPWLPGAPTGRIGRRGRHAWQYGCRARLYAADDTRIYLHRTPLEAAIEAAIAR